MSEDWVLLLPAAKQPIRYALVIFFDVREQKRVLDEATAGRCAGSSSITCRRLDRVSAMRILNPTLPRLPRDRRATKQPKVYIAYGEHGVIFRRLAEYQRNEAAKRQIIELTRPDQDSEE